MVHGSTAQPACVAGQSRRSCCFADAKVVGAEGIDLPPLNAVVTDFVQARQSCCCCGVDGDLTICYCSRNAPALAERLLSYSRARVVKGSAPSQTVPHCRSTWIRSTIRWRAC